MICTGETYKNVVKMIFAKGASLSYFERLREGVGFALRLALGLITKKAPRKSGAFLTAVGLVIADAVVIAAPPIRAPGDEGLSAQPPAIVVGVVIAGAVDPDPYAIPEDPMATPVVKVVVVIMVALSKSAMITVALNEFAMVTVINTASWALAAELSASAAFGQSATAATWSATHTRTAATWSASHARTAATWSATHARTAATWATAAAGNGRTTTTTAHVAAAATTPAAAAATTALFGHKGHYALTERVRGRRRWRGVGGNKRCHCETARQRSRCKKFRTHRMSPSKGRTVSTTSNGATSCVA
jgi:hypothetical protein